MIRPSRLLESRGDRICFDSRGDLVDVDLPPGPAVMAVAPVTDALKVVRDGLVTGSFDRDRVARVVAFAVERALLEGLGEEPMTPGRLIEAVRGRGVRWAVVAVDRVGS